MMQNKLINIEDVPLNRFHRLLTIRSGGGWIMDGYILSILGTAMVAMSLQLGLNDNWQGLIGASALIGIFVGGFLAGPMVDKFGRQRLYFLGPILFTLCSIGQYFAHSGIEILIYRFIIGIGVAFEYTAAGALLVEFVPKKNRGPLLAALTILWFVGAAIAYMIGHYIGLTMGEESWRFVLASPAVLGIILIILRLGTPKSPRWLVSQGRIAEANQVLQKVYGSEFTVENMPAEPAHSQGGLRKLFSMGYGPRLFFVGTFWACSVIPVFAVYAFAPRVLEALRLTGAWEVYGSIAITVMFVVGCLLATFIINSLGRRLLLIHSFLWSGCALVALGLFSDSTQMLVLTLFCLYAILIGGAQVLQLVYPNEIFPTEIRSIGVGVGASLSRIGAAIGTWAVPVLLDNQGIAITMYIAAGVSFFGLIIAIWLAPETRGMDLATAASLKR